MTFASIMALETAEIPACVSGQKNHHHAYSHAGEQLRHSRPRFITTLARGSSDHAATYLKYLFELTCAVPVASLAPSVASVYKRRLALQGSSCFAVSQSGESPDLVSAFAMARQGGADTYVITNAPNAPLLAHGARALPIAAGKERAVAATKSFIGALTAIVSTLCAWKPDPALQSAMGRLPDDLEKALAMDWSAAIPALSQAASVFVIGRGPAFAIANEAALKLKEICELHAEGYSAAEVLHGPLQLAKTGLVALVFCGRDSTRDSTETAVKKLLEAGAQVFVVDPENAMATTISQAVPLPAVKTAHPLLDPISQATSFYRFAEHLSRSKGLDPDRPSLLSKVTQTK